jgi:hypothetical protein
VLVLKGAPALSDFRAAKLLSQLQGEYPSVLALSAEDI